MAEAVEGKKIWQGDVFDPNVKCCRRGTSPGDIGLLSVVDKCVVSGGIVSLTERLNISALKAVQLSA